MSKNRMIRLTTKTRVCIVYKKPKNASQKIVQQKKCLPLAGDEFEKDYQQVQSLINTHINDAIETLSKLQTAVAKVDEYRSLPEQDKRPPRQILKEELWHEYDLKVSLVLNYTNEALATLSKPMASIKKWLDQLSSKSSRSSRADLEKSVKSVDLMMDKLIVLDCERQHGRYNGYIMRRLRLYQKLGPEKMRRQDYELFLETRHDAALLKANLEKMCREINKIDKKFCNQALRDSWRIDC